MSSKLSLILATCTWFASILAAQSSEEGIPVTDPVVIAKCGTCHKADERGNMTHISWARTTPENWQETLKRMIAVNGLSLTPSEARTIVGYLSSRHGLAPTEARPVMYEPERRSREESDIPNDNLHSVCAKCHTFGRVLSWRRSPLEWKHFTAEHAVRYKFNPNDEASEFLAKAAPLRTAEWEAWSARAATPDLTGRWLVTASLPGRGKYYGDMQVLRSGEGEFTTRVNLTSLKDGSSVLRSGRAVLFGGYAWRGRSVGAGAGAGAGGATSAPDDLSNTAKEVIWIAPDQSKAEGRWFWGQYQEFGVDVQLQRPSASPALLAVDRPSLKAGSRSNRIRAIGEGFPANVSPTDLHFGAGTTVRAIISNTSREVVAEVDVSADAPLGKRNVAFRGSILASAIAIYDRVDYLKVTPDSAMATFSDASHPRGYRQFEAIGYQRGPDGKAHTADDLELGPVDAAWSMQVFHATEGSTSSSVGTMSPTGLFAPATNNPENNFDVWAIATARDERDKNGAPLVGKSYMVVTVPTYTFNGRRYVRDLDRWVDEGPASGKLP